MKLDLAVVMPVYNEEACIGQVVTAWERVLSSLEINYRIIVLNDGSTDRTAQVLAAFSQDPHIEVVHKRNSGHGPTILAGYRKAVELADWVFQSDSDGEMPAEHFPRLWEQRESYSALFGTREGRRQPLARKVISGCSRLTVRLLFGDGVKDVNTAYRLMRADILREIVAQIPEDTFAPNVIISGALARAGLPLCHYPVPFAPRTTGQVSIVRWKLWRVALKAFWQTLRCRPVIQRSEVKHTA